MDWKYVGIEAIGWLSTAAFLLSIVLPRRIRLHEWGIFTSITTGFYAYHHGATAIWVKWSIAFFFHLYMWKKLKAEARLIQSLKPHQNVEPIELPVEVSMSAKETARPFDYPREL